MHDYIDWHIKGDGNTYVASLRVNQMTGGDEEAWQAPHKTSTGQWEKVRINLEDFLFTFRGRLSNAKGLQLTISQWQVLKRSSASLGIPRFLSLKITSAHSVSSVTALMMSSRTSIHRLMLAVRFLQSLPL